MAEEKPAKYSSFSEYMEKEGHAKMNAKKTEEKHADLAEQYLAFLKSPEGQKDLEERELKNKEKTLEIAEEDLRNFVDRFGELMKSENNEARNAFLTDLTRRKRNLEELKIQMQLDQKHGNKETP